LTKQKANSGNAGVVKTQYFTFDGPITLGSGQKLGPITLAYETWGKLNSDKSNAILIEHAFSGDSHAAGTYEGDPTIGWWDSLIGPGKAFDTDQYFVICSNVIGGCRGSTGPASIDPKTNKPYGVNFPVITIEDMVEAQKYLLDHLGIDKLLCVSGGSMGGMLALQWPSSYPERVRSAVVVAAALKHSPQQIAFDEVGRQAVLADPNWNNGDFYGKASPDKGLAVARMLGHITYMSKNSMEEKFSRRLKSEGFSFSFNADFEVEGYLRYRGENFVKRFDANSYMYITKAMDYFDLSGEKFFKAGKKITTNFLVISFDSDWLYPTEQSKDIVRLFKSRHIDASFCEIKAEYGHDSFLVETDEEEHLIKHFIKGIK
jgi:homoserine O-acetyltransferase/O-succinyltransferase